MIRQIFTAPMDSPVCYYWQISSDNFFATSHEVLPSPYVQIIFPLNSQIHIKGLCTPITHPFVSPILASPKQISLPPNSSIFGLHIKAEFASLLFRNELKDIFRNANPINDVFWPKIAKRLNQLNQLTTCFNSRIEYVESVLQKRLKTPQEILRYSIKEFIARPNLKIKGLSEDIGYSERWIENQFVKHLGVLPNELFRIIRFNKFLNKIYNNSNGENLTTLAFASGYYDQSHAIREFKKFSGKTPLQIQKNLPVINDILNRN